MSRRLVFGFALALMYAGAQAATYQRIVTLAPHLTEIVYAAGAGAKLVGVSTYSDYPAKATQLPVVASDGRVNFEALYRLQPDLVLAWTSGNRAIDLAELERRGFNVLVTDAKSLPDVARLIRLFGKLAGTVQQAEESAQAYEAHIASLRARYAERPAVSVFVEIWHEPLMTVNGAHVISEVVRLCGATNVFAEVGSLTPIISREQLYAKRPAAVLSTAFAKEHAMREAWQEFGTLDAVRGGHLYAIDPDYLTRLGPRLVEGAEQVCAAVERVRHSEARTGRVG
ncbi:MAG TPA: cobalamin-binding protein, partial [Burkholderiales bacterium]